MVLHKIIEAYVLSHGRDGAEELLQETTAKLGLEGKENLSKEEALLVCKDLQEKAGFVGIVASILIKRLQNEL